MLDNIDTLTCSRYYIEWIIHLFDRRRLTSQVYVKSINVMNVFDHSEQACHTDL